MPLFEAIRGHGASSPRRRAFRLGTDRVTYESLAEGARRVRNALSRLPRPDAARFGMPPQGRLLALCVGNHLRFPEIFVGATASPNTVAVLDQTMPLPRLRDILDRLRPDLLVLSGEESDLAALCRESGIAVKVLDTADPDRSYEAWIATDGRDDVVTGDDVDDGPFLIGFTSGTTSLPKAFIRSRASWKASFRAGRGVFALDRDAVTMAPGALAHGLALYALAEALEVGTEFVTVPAFNAATVARILAESDVRRLVVVPTMIVAIAKAAGERGLGFDRLRQIVSAGAKFEKHHLKLCQTYAPDAEIIEYYGASELGFVAVGRVDEDAIEAAAASVGRPYPGVTIAVCDDDGHERAPGEIGTIHLRSELVSAGYIWGDDGKAFRLTPNGATVGDIGYRTEDGSLAVIGRAGGMVVSNGHNIYVSEVETVISTIATVTGAVVFGVPDPYSGQRLVAVLSTDGDDPAFGRRILAHCRDRLPKHKLPREIYKVQGWPTTSSGKIARQRVEDWIAAGHPGVEPLDVR